MSNWTPTDHTKCKHKFRDGMKFCNLCGMNRPTAESIAELERQLAERRTVTDAQVYEIESAFAWRCIQDGLGMDPNDFDHEDWENHFMRELKNLAEHRAALEAGDE